MELSWIGGMEISSKGRPIYGKKTIKIFFPRTKSLMILTLVIHLVERKYYFIFMVYRPGLKLDPVYS